MNSKFSNSDEVYKCIPNTKSSDNPLRAVKGLYVSGKHRDLYYIDNHIQLSNYTTTKAKIDNMTTKYKDHYDADGAVLITDISYSDTNISYYTTKYKDHYDADGAVLITDVSFSDTDIYEYGRVYENHYDADGAVLITDINIVGTDIILNTHNIFDTNYDGMVTLKSMTTTPATVSVYTV